MHQFEIFFSNRVELLFERLKEHLFVSSSPFARRMVVVPSHAMKSWLMLRMAQDPELGIAAGLEISYLDQAISHLRPASAGDSLSPLELALMIEKEIRVVAAQAADESIWKPLLHYLKVSPGRSLSRKTERRITALSEALASLFIKYGLYGGAMAAEWELNASVSEWQHLLWKKIYESSLWNYPARSLLGDLDKKVLQRETHVHLFSMSYIPKVQHQFLMKLSEHLPMRYYLLSPCSVFWSDIKSDRESERIQKFWKRKGGSIAQLEELDGYLQDRNLLLANSGKLGREMAHQIEEDEGVTCEEYMLPSNVMELPEYVALHSDNVDLIPVEHSVTLLEAVQADMALLRTPDSENKISLGPEEDSIQVHAAHSRMREVQVLYNALLGTIAKHADGPTPIYPGDIIVMAPDISVYAPYIKAVFGSQESVLQAQVMDISLPSRNPFIQAFLHLLSLPSGRWDASSLMQLFDFSAFQWRHGLDREDVHQIREWVKSAGVRWGEDAAHRNELLKRDSCRQGMVEESSVGTWEHGIERIVKNVLTLHSEGNFPLQGVCDFTQSSLLGKWIQLNRSLREDLAILTDGTYLTLSEWVHYLRCLVESYLHVEESDSEVLFSIFSALEMAEQKVGAQKYPFSTVWHQVRGILERKGEHYHREGGDINAVHFCSMLPMRAIPAQVIAMIGMEESAFPRRDANLSLNMLRDHSQTEYTPSQTDFDRYLFLEGILSARRSLIFTYCAYSKEDGKEQPPSLLVTELMSYVDKGFDVGEKKPSELCFRRHPLHSFDPVYFTSQDSRLKNYSKTQYQECKTYCGDTTSTPQVLVSRGEDVEIPIIKITLKDLYQCAKNPVKTYLNKRLGIYLENVEDKILKDEEHFHLSSLQSYMMRVEGIKNPLETVFHDAESAGLLPMGTFKGVAKSKVSQDVFRVQENMKALGISNEDLFSITLTEHCEKPIRLENGDFHLPAMHVQCGETRLQITGTLSDVSAQGLLVQSKDDKEEIAQYWPHYLVLNCLIAQHQLPVEKKLLLVKGAKGKSKEPFFECPHLLFRHYLEYYLRALKDLSPLIPKWIPHFVHLEGESFEKKIQDTFDQTHHPIFNDYLLWVKKGNLLAEPKILLELWKPEAKRVFSEMLMHWYPEKGTKI